MRKGFFFTIDALLATLIATAAVAAALQTAALAHPPSASQTLLAQSILETMDSLGEFKRASEIGGDGAALLLQGALLPLVPNGIAANLTVAEYYFETKNCDKPCRVTGKQPENEFCLCELYSVNSSKPANSSWVSAGRRMYYSPGNDRLGVVTLEVRAS